MPEKNIADSIQRILEKNKGFMTVKGLVAKMKPDEKRAIGIRKSDSGKIISRKIENSAEGRFIFRNKGRSIYILVPCEPSEFVLGLLSEKEAFDPKDVSKLPYESEDVYAVLNELEDEGKIKTHYDKKGMPKIYRASRERIAAETPGVAHSANDTGEYTQENFKAAFDSLDHGRIFVRICDIRRKLGWPREVFDGMIRDLRNRRVIQLHTGDASLMTEDEIADCYIDENNFRMGSVTWHD